MTRNDVGTTYTSHGPASNNFSEVDSVCAGKVKHNALTSPSPYFGLDEVRGLAYNQAQRAGLKEDEAHDCAMEFVLWAIQQWLEMRKVNTLESVVKTGIKASKPLTSVPVGAIVLRDDLTPEQTNFWLRRCARNWAANWRRSLLTSRRHEITYAELDMENETFFTSLPARHAASAEEVAFITLFRQDINAACDQLTSTSRLLFEQFQLYGFSVAEIARESGKSEEAVRQILCRVRRNLRKALTSIGYEVL